MLTGFGNTDGMATIRDDNAVVYSVVDNGGNSDGVHIPNPMYATVKEQENMYTLYQYVPTKVGIDTVDMYSMNTVELAY